MASDNGAPLRRSLRKCRKLNNGVKEIGLAVEQSDPFTRLNDDIIVSHILSRLPLEEKVRSSVLSHRWKTLWAASIGPKLIFPSFLFSRYPAIRSHNFVDRFTPLLTRVISNVLKAYSRPTLDELTVRYDFNRSSSQLIDSWVQYAFRKGVTRLQLDFLPLVPFVHLDRYTFPGIDKLSASHILCNNDLHLPVNCTGMYNLRDVCLKFIYVSSEVVEFMLSYCPFLERLSVWKSNCLEDLRVSTQSSKFKSLEIVNCSYLNIKISSPYLVSLQYCGSRKNLCLEHVPLLSVLSIGWGYCRSFLRNGSLCFGYMSQLKKLTLDLHCKIISESIKYPLEFSNLVKLEHLEVNIHASKQSCLLWPIILIKAAPFLSIFSVKIFAYDDGSDREKRRQETYRGNLLNAVKQVHHQFLKLVEFEGFRGKPMEVELGQHLLEVSSSLEQFVVKPFIPKVRERSHQLVDASPHVKEYRKCAQQFNNWLPSAAKLVIL